MKVKIELLRSRQRSRMSIDHDVSCGNDAQKALLLLRLQVLTAAVRLRLRGCGWRLGLRSTPGLGPVIQVGRLFLRGESRRRGNTQRLGTSINSVCRCPDEKAKQPAEQVHTATAITLAFSQNGGLLPSYSSSTLLRTLRRGASARVLLPFARVRVNRIHGGTIPRATVRNLQTRPA